MVRAPTPRPAYTGMSRAGPARYREHRARLERTKLAPPVRRPPGLVPRAQPRRASLNASLAPPLGGLKLGPQRLKGPNFAKPAHLAQARRGWGLGAGRSGRSAAGRTGAARGCFRYYNFTGKGNPPSDFRRGITSTIVAARKYQGMRSHGVRGPRVVSDRSQAANPVSLPPSG